MNENTTMLADELKAHVYVTGDDVLNICKGPLPVELPVVYDIEGNPVPVSEPLYQADPLCFDFQECSEALAAAYIQALEYDNDIPEHSRKDLEFALSRAREIQLEQRIDTMGEVLSQRVAEAEQRFQELKETQDRAGELRRKLDRYETPDLDALQAVMRAYVATQVEEALEPHAELIELAEHRDVDASEVEEALDFWDEYANTIQEYASSERELKEMLRTAEHAELLKEAMEAAVDAIQTATKELDSAQEILESVE